MTSRTPITRSTRWQDRKGRTWRPAARVVPGGMYDCETVDGQMYGTWRTADIREALAGYPEPQRRACVCGGAA